MKKIFLVYGHYNDKSFNAAIRDTFIKIVENNGQEIELNVSSVEYNPKFSNDEFSW